ncbi:MAG: hypothetical protein ACKOPE_14045 [Novosphingobium sp.]
MRLTRIAALLCVASFASPALAQNHEHHEGMQMPASPAPQAQSQSGHEGHGMGETEPTLEVDMKARLVLPAEGSGTARLPGMEGGMHGLHLGTGDWMVMVHGYASAQYTKATGPRGDDKVYSTSMLMAVAQTEPEWGRVQLKSMFSLEPAMDANGYPNLFATGETAGGLPLVDRQHPHDLFMELAARVDFNIGDQTRLFLYGGPVGEPALGPSAFMHRGSAAFNPEPPIAHHWFDSTHITYGVVTAGLAGRTWQIEGSAFRGREPDERRWNIETPKLDSWSVRGTLTPTPNWAIQASYGEIREPEATHPGENEHRFTASAHYASSAVSAMLAYSAKKRVPGETLSAWLAEVNWKLDGKNVLFGRFENVANDELFPDHHDPLHDVKFRVSKFQAGYARRIPLSDAVELALGGSMAAYVKPSALDPYYGKSPIGYTLFAKLSLGH